MWQFIFMIAQRHNVQVFATTHSLDCLRAFAWASSKIPDVKARVVRQDEPPGTYQKRVAVHLMFITTPARSV